MEQALKFLAQIIGQLATLLGIAQFLQGDTSGHARELKPYDIWQKVLSTNTRAVHPDYGFIALGTKLDNLQTDVGSILTALDGLNVIATVPVQPSWYVAPTTPPSVGDIAAEVWYNTTMTVKTNQDGSSSHTMQELVWEGHDHLTRLAGFRGIPAPNNPYFSLVGNEIADVSGYRLNWTHDKPTIQPGLPAWGSLIAGDTPLSFLQRTQPALSWTLSGPATTWTNGETVWLNAFNGVSTWWWRCNITQAMLDLLLAGTVTAPDWYTPLPDPLVVEVDVPPVWPGVANVTLGSPHTLTSVLAVTETCDGVIVDLTTNPTRTGKYNIGGNIYYYGLGWIAFVTDDGDLEPWQYLGFDGGIFTPKTMKQAGGFVASILAGGEATVTGWVKT